METEEEVTGGCGAVAVLHLPVDDPTFDLEKAVCSHGLFMMAPNRWDSSTKTLHRPLRLSSAGASLPVRISHPSPSLPLRIAVSAAGASLSHQDRQTLLTQVRRMLRISADNDRMVREFHGLHAEAKERGFGRIFRSPTLFEDMVKCILLCNCQWSRTLLMARALCNLQLELRSCLTADNFKPNTPQPRELKRKRGKGRKAVMKLEMKFMDNQHKSAEEENSVVGHQSQPKHPQWEEPSLSVSSDVINIDSCTPVAQISDDICGPLYEIGDFPSPEELAALDVNFLAMRCNLGYRAQRIKSLAKSIVEHKIDLNKLEHLRGGFFASDYEELNEQLSGIHGFGPFTRANILMCMGFYHRIPADTETIRHLKQCHGRKGCNVKSIHNDLEEIYGKYAPFQFLAYWSELWDDYEQRFGKMSEMLPSNYQLITASNMKKRTLKNTEVQ